MRLLHALIALALGLTSGCASVSEGIQSHDGDTVAGAAYFVEHRAAVDPQHVTTYEAPVHPGARIFNSTLALDFDDSGVGLPHLAPARVELTILGPDGKVLGSIALDAGRPAASLVIDPLVTRGIHSVRVSGVGASATLQEADWGATYLLTVEVR